MADTSLSSFLRHFSHQFFFMDHIPVDRIFPIFGRICAYPYGIDFTDLLILVIHKLYAILRGNHAAAVIDPTPDDRVTRIKIILRFNIEDQACHLSRPRHNRIKTDIISDRSFFYRTVFRLGSPDRCQCPASGFLHFYPYASGTRINKGFPSLFLQVILRIF